MNVTCFAFTPPLPGRAAWAANPTCRGTFDIITLCLSTTIICIWSSIHNDIPAAQPPPKASGRDVHSNTRIGCINVVLNAAMCWFRQTISGVLRMLRNKGPTVIVAFFCPALLLMRAIDQYSIARKLRDLAKERKPNIQFTIVHGFYATMGGFQLDVRDSRTGEPFENTTFERTRLSTNGVRFLMGQYTELLTVPTIESIKERAKSNSLGKAVLALQVVWFIVNCASRLAENLPLSLMEVSTLAHGLCTLLTYFAWWSKPFNVDGPTGTRIVTEIENKRRALEGIEVRTEDDAKIARWRCWVQFFDKQLEGSVRGNNIFLDFDQVDPTFDDVEELFNSLPVDASLVDNPDAQARELAKDLTFLVDILSEWNQAFLEFQNSECPAYRFLLYLAGVGEAEHPGFREASKDEVLDGVRRLGRDPFKGKLVARLFREAAYSASGGFQTTRMAMILLHMHYCGFPVERPQDINVFDLLRPKSATKFGSLPVDPKSIFSSYFLHETSPTFHDLFGALSLTAKSENKLKAIDYISISVVPLLYNSLHLLGWWKQFPSLAEQVIWRAATVVAMSSGFAATVIYLIHRTNFGQYFSRKYHYVTLVFFESLLKRIIPSLYAISSTFLIVESFRQLWFLPSEAYLVSTWSYYFPHLF
ncbi:hypothetical protein SCHPADRAFT_891194 [Schizopora paradoxa]|uniref:Uncharacterized protein n=1 Tax=Schizopora paradoxa TaxID=27342 RepID=A0A0H2RR41_9AGAM|nr:hypothetical protein SCHPADRAFT_891194 [Schizopora paradoxa]